MRSPSRYAEACWECETPSVKSLCSWFAGRDARPRCRPFPQWAIAAVCIVISQAAGIAVAIQAGDGAWNTQGATLNFYILPAWYSPRALQFLSIPTIIAIATFAYWVRMQQYAAVLKVRLDERLEERIRLARDQLDTLIQTIHGSKMVAENARYQVEDPLVTRHALDRIAEWLEAASREGRTALEALRISEDTGDLLAALRRAAVDCGPQRSIHIHTSTIGQRRDLHPIARDEVYRIGYEAVRNACTHSGAAELWIEVEYKRRVRLLVRDNGRGFDVAARRVSAGGNFGIAGMQERARRIGGTLTISSSVDSGTAVSLSIPGRAIYQNTSRGFRAWLFRLLGGGRRPTIG
jgi:signal transduction histidine kinase